MKKPYSAVLLLVLFYWSCRSRTAPEQYLSIPSLVESQVAHVDTSLYAITRYDFRGTDTVAFDTIYIPREAFREQAKPFLSIPDLSVAANARRFKEESRYDELLKRVIITYTPLHPEQEEVQKEEVMVAPDAAVGDKVTTLLTTRIKNDRNGLLQEELLWMIDNRFTIVRTRKLPGQEAEVITTKVIWNDN